MKYLTQFPHTGTLEVSHVLYNKCSPKSQHFSYPGMVMRSRLAVLAFNSGSGLEQTRTKTEEKKCNVHFSKITKAWSSKLIKAKKDNYYLKEMVPETTECTTSKPHFEFQ